MDQLAQRIASKAICYFSRGLGLFFVRRELLVQTHLSAFIDCHSRFILDARYYLRESLDILIDTLLRAWSLHGASNELYLDNVLQSNRWQRGVRGWSDDLNWCRCPGADPLPTVRLGVELSRRSERTRPTLYADGTPPRFR